LRVATAYGSTPVYRVPGHQASFLYLNRHGDGHQVPPHDIPYPANVAALRYLGVRHAIGLCAVGSLAPDLEAGDTVLLSDFVAVQQMPPISSVGRVAHTALATPYCPVVRGALQDALGDRTGFRASGILVGVTGPRFETPAEIRWLGGAGDVVGMTGVQEAITALEAGLCYAALACVTNLGTGLAQQAPAHGDVSRTMADLVAQLAPAILSAASAICDPPLSPEGRAVCPRCASRD
jgi:5'-methylthioadenosine phosphorylase